MTSYNGIATALSAAVLMIGACSPETGASDEPRVRLGKADNVGSCVDSDCNGPATTGTCWCDESCKSYGDCCEDEPIVCRAKQCGGFAGLPCPAGLECIDYPYDDCDPAHGGADCGGVCVEPPPAKHCGGFAGLTCASNEFCAYAPEDNCGFADATGVCAPRPEACAAVYDPVCGCNGQTYSNACTAMSAGVSVKATGECAPANDCAGAGGVCLTSAVECPADTVSLDASCGDAAQQCCKPALFPPPPASNSCVGHCGGQSADGSCWCDSACETYGDCCADHTDAC